MIRDHLLLVRQLAEPENGLLEFSNRDIIDYQALLMTAGGITFATINSGEISSILGALAHTAHIALEASNRIGQDIPAQPQEIYQIYQMLPMMQLLSKKIHDCSSGELDSYLNLYHCCAALANNFLNADFNKAFFAYHQWRQTCRDIAINTFCDAALFPDLTDCLYE